MYHQFRRHFRQLMKNSRNIIFYNKCQKWAAFEERKWKSQELPRGNGSSQAGFHWEVEGAAPHCWNFSLDKSLCSHLEEVTSS